MVFPLTPNTAAAQGTQTIHTRIATAADLLALGDDSNDYDKHFVLMADIDLDPNLPGGKVFDKVVIAPDANAAGKAFKWTPFTGVFDGHGHTISHLTTKGEDYVGLFGHFGRRTTPAGEIKNLVVADVNIAVPAPVSEGWWRVTRVAL